MARRRAADFGSCRSAPVTSASNSREHRRHRDARAAIAKIKVLPEQPSFLLHTGDLSTCRSRPSRHVSAGLSELSMPVFYVPGEHDVLEDDGRSYFSDSEGTQGAGWQTSTRRACTSSAS